MTEYGSPQPPSRDLCATMLVHRQLLNESMTYRSRRAAIENRALQYERGRRASLRTEVVTLPVVVHVVYNPKTPELNICDAQIHSQIEVLNKDFRATNPDVGNVPAVWQPLVADARGRVPARDARSQRQPDRRNHPHPRPTARFVPGQRRQVRAPPAAPTPGRATSTSTSGSASWAAACSATPSSPAARPRPTASSSCTPPSGPPAPRRRPSTAAAPRRTRSATG